MSTAPKEVACVKYSWPLRHRRCARQQAALKAARNHGRAQVGREAASVEFPCPESADAALRTWGYVSSWPGTVLTLSESSFRVADVGETLAQHLLRCWLERIDADESHCLDARDWEPSHRQSRAPCRFLNLAPKEDILAPWPGLAAYQAGHGRWRIDRQTLWLRVLTELARTRAYLCPSFSWSRLHSWWDLLPESIEYAADGWQGALDELGAKLAGSELSLVAGELEIIAGGHDRQANPIAHWD